MKNKFILILRIVISAILLQTLFFKFTGATESIFIFSSLGAEPWGRWGSGFAELIASILLLIPMSYTIGALLSIGIMMGALASHIFILGIEIQNDGGLLFFLALLVFVLSIIVVFFERERIYIWIEKIKKKFIN